MRFVKQAKVLYILTSLLIFLAGLILMLFPAATAEVLCYIAGGLLIVCGIAKIIGYFSNDPYRLAFQFDLALGVLFAALGIILLLHPGIVMSALPFLMGLYILIDGVFKLQTAVDAKRFGLSKWWLILLGALACILLGVLLIFNPFEAGAAMMMLMGASLMVDGLQHLFNAIYTIRIRKDC